MDVTVEDLLLISGVFAIGFFVAVAFDESLSTRDVAHRPLDAAGPRGLAPRVVRGSGAPAHGRGGGTSTTAAAAFRPAR